MRTSYRILIGIVLAGSWASTAFAGYDAAADFSPTSNPNGVWSYGYSTTLGGAFSLDTTRTSTSNLDLWEGNIAAGNGLYSPFIIHNGTANTINSGTVQYLPGQLGIQPGPQDQYGVIRFTSPTAGMFNLQASFSGMDFTGPTTTDVHVLVDGVTIFNGSVNGFGPGSGPSFNSILTLKAGDTVDFAVGYGSNENYYYDTTGVSANLSSVPEPSSVVLAGIAGLMTAGYGIRKRCRSKSQA